MQAADLEAALLESGDRDIKAVDQALAVRSLQALQAMQPEVALLKFLTEARAVRLLPENKVGFRV
jgi:hypothetical protein